MEPTEEIRRSLFEKLRRHFERHVPTTKGDTEIFDRVLALWIDLQRAMQDWQQRDANRGPCYPWSCLDDGVKKAWMALTNPLHALALQNLFCQLPDGPQSEIAQKALAICRGRRDERRSMDYQLSNPTPPNVSQM